MTHSKGGGEIGRQCSSRLPTDLRLSCLSHQLKTRVNIPRPLPFSPRFDRSPCVVVSHRRSNAASPDNRGEWS